MTPIGQSNFGGPSYHHSLLDKQVSILARADCSNDDDNTSPPSKYKSSLLNRYLNDTLRHVMAAKADTIASACGKRCLSQSFGSNECDRDLQNQNPQREDGQGWREIHAAVALTSLAQGKSCKAGLSSDPGPTAAKGQSCIPEPFSVSKASIAGRLCVTGAVSALKQSTETALTSRIIQKSSHISEIQTVKVALANSG
ncbi:hypothetical protein XENOCAPTIV_004134 [Xenoophorus captivus]|uniref:Uncharacterized protein n=1 Tax=Xenoophorus captivus TaxID=1517983 RepID=A0ABV0RNY8_9TELE